MSDMNKEKKAELIQDALDYLDDDMLESVDALRKRNLGTAKSGKRDTRKMFFRYSRVLAVAASVCLLVMGAYAWDSVMGPLDGLQSGPMGTENAPNMAPGWNENVEGETEIVPSLPEEDASVDKEESTNNDIWQDSTPPGDVNSEVTLPEDTSQEDPHPGATESPEEPLPPEGIEPEKPELYPPLGDAYHLKDNYVKVTMLPYKAWDAEASLADNLAKSREIEEKYYGTIDRFVDALCTTPLIKRDLALEGREPGEDTYMYYLFFRRTNGETVQVGILGDYGLVYFEDRQEYYMKIDREILIALLKILWLKW